MKTDQYAEELLFRTDGQEIYRITNDGDNSEPEKLCDNSLIRIEGAARGGHHDVVLTALEMDDLAKQWLTHRQNAGMPNAKLTDRRGDNYEN